MGKYDYLVGGKATTTAPSSGKYSYLVKKKETPLPKEKKPPKPVRRGVIGGLQTLYRDVKETVLAPTKKRSLNPFRAVNRATNTAVQGVADTLADTFERYKRSYSAYKDPKASFGQKVVAQAELSMGLVNTALSPITSSLQGAEELPSVIGSTATAINRFFGVLGTVGSDVGEGAVEALPVSDKTKALITPLAQEVGALVAQIAAGKASLDKVKAVREKSKTIAEHIDQDIIEQGIVAPEAVKPAVVPEAAAPKPVDPLLTEAAAKLPDGSPKYKSAEEFVGNLSKKEFRYADSVSPKATIGEIPMSRFDGKDIRANQLTVDVSGVNAWKKKISAGERPYVLVEKSARYPEVSVIGDGHTRLTAYKELGIDTIPVIDNSGGAISGSKSQLTDIWKKAQREGVQVPNTRATTLERAAVEKKLTDSLGELPTHERMSMADQASRAVDFIERSPDQALKVIRGEAVPDGILPEALYTAMEIKAIKNGDVAMLKELANSPIPTTAGQAMKALDSVDPYSPVRIMRDLQQFREAKAEKKSGKKRQQAVKDTVLEIKKEVQKSVSKRPSWEEFLKEIQCK